MASEPITLSRFVMEQVGENDLAFIINAISVATKVISNAVQHTGIKSRMGAQGATTPASAAGLENLAHDVMFNALRLSQKAGLIVSVLKDEPIFPTRTEDSNFKFAVVFDALDGSSNVEVNISVGTIFGIYQIADPQNPKLSDVLQPGNKMVAAGYVLYGSAVVMMLTVGGRGVHSFIMDTEYGEFILSNPSVRIPDSPATVYSINSGNSEFWDVPTEEFVRWIKGQTVPYSARYVGTMVSDVHRTVLKGGIFMYPCDRLRSPEGKLRLLCESFPLALIMEQAGGGATTGTTRILDIIPTSLHQTSPIYLGCHRDVERLQYFYQAHLSGHGAHEGTMSAREEA